FAQAPARRRRGRAARALLRNLDLNAVGDHARDYFKSQSSLLHHRDRLRDHAGGRLDELALAHRARLARQDHRARAIERLDALVDPFLGAGARVLRADFDSRITVADAAVRIDAAARRVERLVEAYRD